MLTPKVSNVVVNLIIFLLQALVQQLRQLGDIRCDPSRLVARKCTF
jgi:hypothetical protein